jgi:hypothetical protein
MGIIRSAVKQVALAAIVVLGKRIATKVAGKMAEKATKPRPEAGK